MEYLLSKGILQNLTKSGSAKEIIPYSAITQQGLVELEAIFSRIFGRDEWVYWFLRNYPSFALSNSQLAVISLTTPAAIVVPISLRANRPNSGYSWNASMHNGLRGWIFTSAESPVFKDLGCSCVVWPVLGSIDDTNSIKVAATWVVWACKTGV